MIGLILGVFGFGGVPKPSAGLFPQEPWAPETSATGGTILRITPGSSTVIYSTNGVALFKSLDGGRTWTSRFENFFLTPLDMVALDANFLFLYSDDHGLLYSTDGASSFGTIGDVPTGASAAKFCLDFGDQGLRTGLVLTIGNEHRIYFNDSPGDTENWSLEATITESDADRQVSDAFFYWPFGIITTVREEVGDPGVGKLYYTIDGSNWLDAVLNETGEIHDLAMAPMPNDNACFMLATERGLVVFGENFPNDRRLFPFGALSKVVVSRVREDTVIAYLAPRRSTMFRKVRIIWRQSSSGITCTVIDSVGVPEGMADAVKIPGIDSLIIGTYGLGVALSDSSLNLQEANDGLYAWFTMYPGGLWAKGGTAYAIDVYGRLIRTANGGRNWEILPLDPFGFGTAVAACPAKPEVVYAAALGVDAGTFRVIWKSEDGGQTWQLVGPDYQTDPFIPVKMAVSWGNPNEVWAIRVNYSGAVAISYSQDGGQTWQQITGINATAFNWVATAPGEIALWATNNGVWMGRPGSWERVPGLTGEAKCVFFNPADSAIYALGTSTLFKLEGDTLRPVYSFSPSVAVAGDADALGDIVILAYSPGNVPQVFYSQDLGQTWEVDTTFVASNSVGLIGYGKAITTSIGQGIRHGPWTRSEPYIRVFADPDSVEVGDTIFVRVETNTPLKSVACTLYLPQDTVPVSLEAQDAFTYKGEIYTGGLYGGRGAVRAVGVTYMDDTLTGEDSVVVTLPGGAEGGEIIVADSVFPWPNPAGDELNFHLFSETGAQVTVVLINVEGRSVANAKAELRPMQPTDISVDISRVSSGLYVWKVLAENGGKRVTLSGKLAVRK